MLVFADTSLGQQLSALPDALIVNRTSWAFPLAWLPIQPLAVTIASHALHAGCVLALLGMAVRPALIVATLAGVYVLGVTQHFGAVAHHHHMVWFLAVLAASPCADVLSIDAARRAAAGAPRPKHSAPRYAIPVWTCRILIALIFFFPGAWKLIESGWSWIASDNLRNQMYWKWYQHAAVPWLRIDGHPTLCRVVAFAAVAFELTFIVAIMRRSLRHAYAALAIAFHLFTDVVMFISFTSLVWCYVVVVDARRLLRGLAAELFPNKLVISASPAVVAALRSSDVLARTIYRRGPQQIDWLRLSLRHPLAFPTLLAARLPKPPRATTSVGPSLAVAAVVIGANALCGFAGTTQSWPFATYPTFQWLAADEIPHLYIDASSPIDTRPRTQKQWGVQWSVIGVTQPFDLHRLSAYLCETHPELERFDTVRAFRAHSSVVPERAHAPPRRKELLAELSVVCSDARP